MKRSRKLKVAIFAGQPLSAFFEKGEIKERYYNPENLFDEVHFFSFTQKDIQPNRIRVTVGKAKAFIHAVGPFRIRQWHAMKNRIMHEMRRISPDVIRAYTPGPKGWLAAEIARESGVPFVLSLHTNFDDLRDLALQQHRLPEYARLLFSKVFAEKKSISAADAVICVYSFIVPYAEKYGAKNPIVIYNKVYAKNFSTTVKPTIKKEKHTVITVGRLIPEKDPENIIKAVAKIGCRLILIGNGPLREKLLCLAKQVDCDLIYKPAVANSHLPSYYASADVFALALNIGGVAIPALEAMAAGLPVVVSSCKADPRPEIVSDVGIVVDNTPAGFEQAFRRLFSDPALRSKIILRSRKQFLEIEGEKMEKKEAGVYRRLIWKSRTLSKDDRR